MASGLACGEKELRSVPVHVDDARSKEGMNTDPRDEAKHLSDREWCTGRLLQGSYPKLSIAPDCRGEQRRIRITHPFHPLFGREFDLVTYRNTWFEERVYFYDAEGNHLHLPARWTDVFDPDPFVVISAGRARFRLADLVELRRLLNDLDALSLRERVSSSVK